MNSRNFILIVLLAGATAGCTTPDPNMRRPPEALGASSGAGGGGTVGFSSARADASVDASNADYWKIDAE